MVPNYNYTVNLYIGDGKLYIYNNATTASNTLSTKHNSAIDRGLLNYVVTFLKC